MTEGVTPRLKGGRPAKDKADRRDCYIGFWVTATERAAIEGRAAAAGVPSLSQFARASALFQRIRYGRASTHSPELVAQLRRVGNNLNQCLKEARTGNFPPAVARAAEEALKDISALLRAQLHDP